MLAQGIHCTQVGRRLLRGLSSGQERDTWNGLRNVGFKATNSRFCYFLNACAIIGRAAPLVGPLPIGVVTGLIGGPLFLAVLLRRTEAL